jgi:uncharacterized protein involved in exopolysaccharide biosynthesis
VSFVASDAEVAMKVADRLAMMLVSESIRERASLADATTQFIGSQIEALRNRIIAYERRLDDLRA